MPWIANIPLTKPIPITLPYLNVDYIKRKPLPNGQYFSLVKMVFNIILHLCVFYQRRTHVGVSSIVWHSKIDIESSKKKIHYFSNSKFSFCCNIVWKRVKDGHQQRIIRLQTIFYSFSSLGRLTGWSQFFFSTN